MRISKQLLAAIISLIVSVVLCVGVCLAWFSINSNVDSDLGSAGVDDGDIVSFTVTAYYLDLRTGGYVKSIDGDVETIGERYEVDSAPKGVLNAPIAGSSSDKDEMRPYNLVTTYTTAILLEVRYELKTNGNHYKIFASCPTITDSQKTVTVTQDTNQLDVYESALSNAVYFTTAEESSGVYTQNNDKSSFVVTQNQNYVKDGDITLTRDIVATGSGSTMTGTEYYILDYDSAFLNYLYRVIAGEGGSRNSRLRFDGDISLGIRMYDPEGEVVPESIEFLSGTRTQEQGANVLTSTWSFRVTYSDNSTKQVAGSDYSIYANMDTRVVGENKVATVTYTEEGVSVSTTVTYSITEKAHDHLYGAYKVTTVPTKTTTGLAVSECSICGDALTLTLPVLTDPGYIITGNTAQPGVAGQATYTIRVDNVPISFMAATDPLATVAVTGVTLNKDTATLTTGSTETLNATVTPSNATNKGVVWSSSNTNVATVSQTGVVTAKTAGTATITVTTDDGGKTATCIVTVEAPAVPVTGVTLNKTTASLDVGDTETLTATVAPSNATNKGVSWSSSNTSVATVADGVVTAVGAGSATITVTTADGSKTATCTVTVTAPTYTVTFNANGHGTDPTAQTTSGGKLSSLPTMTVAGYTFGGWYENAACTGAAVTVNKEYSSDTTLYAKWTAVNTGATANGTYTMGSSDLFTFSNVTEGSNVTLSSNNNTVTITLNLTTDQKFTVNATASSGSVMPLNITATGSTTPTGTQTLVNITSKNTNTQGSVEYTVNADGIITLVISRGDSHNITIRSLTVVVEDAQTAPTEYTVTFNANGHGTAPTAQTVANGETATQPTAPTATGYTFGGWYEEAACTTAFSFATPITADITLYAKWTINTYTVAFNTDGGSTVASQTVDYNAKATRPATDPTKTGYTFDDWYTTANGTTKFNFNTAITDNTTIYAHWTQAASATEYTYGFTDTNMFKLNGATIENNNRLKFGANAQYLLISLNVEQGDEITISATGTANDTSKGFGIKVYSEDGTSLADSQLITGTSAASTVSATVTATSTGRLILKVGRQGGTTTNITNLTVSVTGSGGSAGGFPDNTVAVTGVTLNKTTTGLTVGDTETLTATVAPSNATNKSVSWSSSNDTVASVSSSGKITANAAGTATITVTTADGSKTATCTVTVTGGGGGGESNKVTVSQTGSTWDDIEIDGVDISMAGSSNSKSGSVDGIDYTIRMKFESSKGTVTMKNNGSTSKTIRIYVYTTSTSTTLMTRVGDATATANSLTAVTGSTNHYYLDVTVGAGETVTISKGTNSSELVGFGSV